MAARPPAQPALQPPQPTSAGVSGSRSVSGPPQARAPGPQQQPPSSAQLVAATQIQAAQSGPLPQQEQDFDPLQRYKLLMPRLKESLQNLMKAAAQNLVQNTNIDSDQKGSEGGLQRFDKSLEEFYALCDQLELCLRLAYECLSQSYHSIKHFRTRVPTTTRPDTVEAENLPYLQYLSIIKAQIRFTKDIHNALRGGGGGGSNKISGKPQV